MAQSLLNHPKAFMRELALEYEIADEDAILEFLERYPDVAPLLSDIRANIRRFFGEEPVRLELSYDPECPEVDPDLVANIQTLYRSQEALDRLHQFDDAWWIKKLGETNAPLIVSIEHVRRV